MNNDNTKNGQCCSANKDESMNYKAEGNQCECGGECGCSTEGSENNQCGCK